MKAISVAPLGSGWVIQVMVEIVGRAHHALVLLAVFRRGLVTRVLIVVHTLRSW